MSMIALAHQATLDRVRSSSLSLREIARRAGIAEGTVRRFARTGGASVETVSKLESAMDQPCGPGLGGDRPVDPNAVR